MSKELIIGLTESGRDSLLRTAQAVPEDKLNWKPLDNGRTVLDLLGDAAQMPLFAIQLMEQKESFQFDRERFQQATQARATWTRDEAIEHLNRNTKQMIAAIGALTDEELNTPIHLPMGGGMTLPLSGWLMMAYRTFTSRFAQINYIQTLYGDFES
ncbi:MAG: hypothetical protein JWN98_2304, partial [Abditibacteriota bacterium]|nr:hypothetical protein [Abditibacteriota bacterium]